MRVFPLLCGVQEILSAMAYILPCLLSRHLVGDLLLVRRLLVIELAIGMELRCSVAVGAKRCVTPPPSGCIQCEVRL
jgi:hypothetical protein